MRKYLIILLTLSMMLPLVAQTITCSGSTTVLPIAQATAETFMDKYPQINISVRGGGSGVGIAALQNGTVDIANSSRKIKSKEISAARARGIDPRGYAVANDGIVMIVHASNKLKELSSQQIRDIYTGKIKNWSQLGGENLPIVIISRDVASGTFEVFNEKALKNAKVDASAQMLASNNAVVSTVTNTPGAIGYAGLGYVNNDVKVLVVDGVMPSVTTVQEGSYPFSRKLYMYTNGKANGNIAGYIGFIQGPQGQKIVEDNGFIRLD
ncbi:MAG: PstS family phosphate ABC transporter substrate-binding protein [Candidatus Cloacimonetes bacterium]|nr:PstS family phosphate ABC transporter substrate-binding protein [Candidatus Cloacimonadota bacterium]